MTDRVLSTDRLVYATERLLELMPIGTEEHHEMTNALWAMRRVHQIVSLIDHAKAGAIGPPDPPKRPDHLRVVK